MISGVEAVFENGLLRPLEPLPLAEREQVRLNVIRKGDVDSLDSDYSGDLPADSGPVPSLREVREALSKIRGSMDEAIQQDRGEY